MSRVSSTVTVFLKKYYSLLGAIAIVSMSPWGLSLRFEYGEPLLWRLPNELLLSFAFPFAYIASIKVAIALNCVSHNRLKLCAVYTFFVHIFLSIMYFWFVSSNKIEPVVFLASMVLVFILLLVQPIVSEAVLNVLSTSRKVARIDQVERAKLFHSQLEANVGRTVWVFSFTGVSNEPRVLRQAKALSEAGWRVVILGYDGHSNRPNEWNYVRLPLSSPYSANKLVLLKIMQMVSMFCLQYFSFCQEFFARKYHRGISNWRYIREESLRLLVENPELKPDLVISHDYFTCDVGYSVAQKVQAKFSVDCHEYSAGQYMEDKHWVKYQRPYVIAMQNYYLSKANVVTTVCKGIADLLNSEHQMQTPTVVIRSVPFVNEQAFREVGDRITVLYHGDISYARGLQKAIQSLPLWRQEFRLLIRGAGDEKHIKFLKDLAVELGVEDRVSIEGPVSFNQIIPKANEADIGYFVHRDISPQKRFTLPNKFFEYIMAGVALCVSDLPEMARIVNEYKCGKLISEYDKHEIAEVINSFDREVINNYKQASLRAAKKLSWGVEGEIMLETYRKLYEKRVARKSTSLIMD